MTEQDSPTLEELLEAMKDMAKLALRSHHTQEQTADTLRIIKAETRAAIAKAETPNQR